MLQAPERPGTEGPTRGSGSPWEGEIEQISQVDWGLGRMLTGGIRLGGAWSGRVLNEMTGKGDI